MSRIFNHTAEDFKKAKDFLKLIDKYEAFKNNGFSTDGFYLVDFAESEAEKLKPFLLKNSIRLKFSNIDETTIKIFQSARGLRLKDKRAKSVTININDDFSFTEMSKLVEYLNKICLQLDMNE